MSRGTVVLLCNLTDAMAKDWLAAGYCVVMVDPQHGVTSTAGALTRMACTIVEAAPALSTIRDAVLVAGFPPCTDVSLSGTRWWAGKRAKDPYFQAKAAIVAEQCRMISMMLGARWFFENPASAFSRIFGRPQHKFHPHMYSQLCPDDNYLKDTWIWSGGGFVMPAPCPDPSLGEPDRRIHLAPPGPDRANFRSATPRGFARAVFEANAPHLAANDNQQERTHVAA